jgi:hypothetical protein
VRWYDASITTDIRNSVERLTAGLNADEITISTAWLDLDTNGTNETVRVIVTYQFQTATPVLTRLLGQAGTELTLSSRATMRMER